MQTWLIAQGSRSDFLAFSSDALRRQIVKTAIAEGFFSIWMKVFEADPVMRKLFIAGFPGTAVDCFDPDTTHPTTPRLANGFANGSKV